MKEISPLRYRIQQIKRKFPYVWMSLIIVTIYLLFYFLIQPNIIGLYDDIQKKLRTLMSIAIGLAGILLIILGIILSVNKKNSFAYKFFKSKHFSIYIITVMCGITSAIFASLFYLFMKIQVVIITFSLVTLSEFLVLLYYNFYFFKQYIAAVTAR